MKLQGKPIGYQPQNVLQWKRVEILKEEEVKMVNYSLGGIAKLVIVVAIIGILLGLALSNTELLNPKRSQVEAKIREQKASLEAQRESMNLEAYRKEQEIRLEMLKRRKEEELAYQQNLHQLLLALFQTSGIIVAVGIALSIAAIGIGKAASLVATSLAAHRAYQARIQELRTTVWRLARANEELERELERQRRKLAELIESRTVPIWEEAERCTT